MQLVSFTTRDGKKVQFYKKTSTRKRKSRKQLGGFIKSFFKARRRALPSRVRGTMRVLSGKLPW